MSGYWCWEQREELKGKDHVRQQTTSQTFCSSQRGSGSVSCVSSGDVSVWGFDSSPAVVEGAVIFSFHSHSFQFYFQHAKSPTLANLRPTGKNEGRWLLERSSTKDSRWSKHKRRKVLLNSSGFSKSLLQRLSSAQIQHQLSLMQEFIMSFKCDSIWWGKTKTFFKRSYNLERSTLMCLVSCDLNVASKSFISVALKRVTSQHEVCAACSI